MVICVHLKIEALHRLINFLNKKEQYLNKIPIEFLTDNKLVKLGLDKSNLSTNSWLSGFLDADSHFYFLAKKRLDNLSGKYELIKLYLEIRISQRTVYHNDNWVNSSYLPIMTDICNFLEVKRVLFKKTKQRITKQDVYHPNEYTYLVKVTSIKSVDLLIEYLDKFPLYLSKRLDYLDWKQMHLTRKSLLNKRATVKNRILKWQICIKLKESINSKRTFFCWKHLDYFFV